MTWTTQPRSDAGGLAAIVAGQGPLVVLLHGVGLRAEAWNAQIDALAGHCQVVAPDLPGHGGNPPLPPGATLDDYADAVANAWSGPAVLVGHSMGAMIALAIATRHPGQVGGLAALNAIYQRSPTARAGVLARAAELGGARVGTAATLDRWFGAVQSAERAACRQWLRAVDPVAYKTAYTVFAAEDGPDPAALSALDVPALFMTGADEPNSTPAMSRKMAAIAPRATALIVDGAAHMMPMTHAEAVNAALASLVAECTA